jgi:hypothetical protein
MEIFIGIIGILIAHYLADFYYQSREVALKKSDNPNVLLLHVVIYTVTFFAFFFVALYYMYLIGFITLLHAFQIALGVSLVNGILHFTIDFFTSKINKYFWQKEKVRGFWLMIGFDQLLHTGLLIFSYAQMLQNMNYIK